MLEPESIVEGRTRRYGRFARRPDDVNPLDEFGSLTRPLRRLRLKEWVGFTVLHPEWAASMIVQDAHYLASSEMYVAHRDDGTRHEWSVNARGGSVELPSRLAGSAGIARRGYSLRYTFAAGGDHHVDIDLDGAPPAKGRLVLHAVDASAPLSVSSRLPGGQMYTHKVLFPVSGSLDVGDRTIEFDPGRDLAILDEHRSMLPYRTHWVWGTFGEITSRGTVGANFVDRPELPGQEEESALWGPGTCEPLSDVTFTPAGETDPWDVSSADGRLDVRFTPQGRKHVTHQLGLFAIDYVQMFGTYDGTMTTADGAHDVTGVPGVLERMDARL